MSRHWDKTTVQLISVFLNPFHMLLLRQVSTKFKNMVESQAFYWYLNTMMVCRKQCDLCNKHDRETRVIRFRKNDAGDEKTYLYLPNLDCLTRKSTCDYRNDLKDGAKKHKEYRAFKQEWYESVVPRVEKFEHGLDSADIRRAWINFQ